MALGVLCASGGAILVSQALGQGDTERVRNVFSTAVCFDLLIYVKPDSILLRMRDNGRPFDPLACLRERAQDDPEATLGLQMINGITDSFEHRSSVGLNITLMTLHRE